MSDLVKETRLANAYFDGACFDVHPTDARGSAAAIRNLAHQWEWGDQVDPDTGVLRLYPDQDVHGFVDDLNGTLEANAPSAAPDEPDRVARAAFAELARYASQRAARAADLVDSRPLHAFAAAHDARRALAAALEPVLAALGIAPTPSARAVPVRDAIDRAEAALPEAGSDRPVPAPAAHELVRAVRALLHLVDRPTTDAETR